MNATSTPVLNLKGFMARDQDILDSWIVDSNPMSKISADYGYTITQIRSLFNAYRKNGVNIPKKKFAAGQNSTWVDNEQPDRIVLTEEQVRAVHFG